VRDIIRTCLSGASSIAIDAQWTEVNIDLPTEFSQQDIYQFGKHKDNKDKLDKSKFIINAAVLVPICMRQDGYTVLFTQRPLGMNKHAGQVSFPGGKVEDKDFGPMDTALRESKEEVGLLSHNVEVVGILERCLVGTGYQITPVVGLVRDSACFKRNPSEVEEIFEVPLSFVLNHKNYYKDKLLVSGVTREFNVIEFEKWFIWGATAAILVNLRDIIVASA